MATVEEFATEIDNTTNQIGTDVSAIAQELANLRAQIASGGAPDLTVLDGAVSRLHATADQLHQVAAVPPAV